MPPPDLTELAARVEDLHKSVLRLTAMADLTGRENELLFAMITDMGEALGMESPRTGLTIKQWVQGRREQLKEKALRELETADPAEAARLQHDTGRDLPPIDG